MPFWIGLFWMATAAGAVGMVAVATVIVIDTWELYFG